MPISRLGRLWCTARSALLLGLYSLYVLVVVGPGQRLIVWPFIALFPARRRSVLARWVRAHLRVALHAARAIAGVRISVRGAISPASCVVLMNHQSIVDIPIGLTLMPGPLAVIPTRDRYRRGIPGISPYVRMAGFPFVTQRPTALRSDLQALKGVVDDVARGEQSLLIFPEGHRTRDGEIGQFMKAGLRLILKRTHCPVYCIVADGMWTARTYAEAAANFSHAQVRVVVLGPFASPAPAAIDAFIDSLRDRMVAALADLRAS
ncbi:MAG TPA: lysophospholipid acyltransferase family protein [Gemmatimonadaceae bacterium]|nr:lysophospholipid acyltransferase family protein [Gemmatimonadaceae bacterium]